MAYSAKARAISHRDWSRKKAPISRVGSYDFNGTVDRATMKMHMAAAERPQGVNQHLLTLWPLSSTAIDKSECFAVREREVLWTYRPGKHMARVSDGRMKALSSLNYFRLVLSTDQMDELRMAMGSPTGEGNVATLQKLKLLVGSKRMEDSRTRGMTVDQLNLVDHCLRNYVLATIQYAGVAITGEEAGSRQSLQGIAVTVGGLNTLANNGDKTLCPGMKLCMTVPRCVPDSAAWPAPCDHIGLPHGKVVPILRQADGSELSQMIMTRGLGGIYRHVAQLMTGCCDGVLETAQAQVKEEDVPLDVYFAFTSSSYKNTRNVAKDYTGITVREPEVANDQLDVMRRMNDAVVFTMSASKKKTNLFVNKTNNRRYTGKPVIPDMYDDSLLSFGANTGSYGKTPGKDIAENKADKQAGPLMKGITPFWRLIIIAFGNVRDVVLANAGSTTEGRLLRTKFYAGGKPLDDSYRSGSEIEYLTNTRNGLPKMFADFYNNTVPDCLGSGAVDNSKDLDASHYAEMIVDVMDYAHKHFSANAVTLNGDLPRKVVYHEMQAVSNGNASFALGVAQKPHGKARVDEMGLAPSEKFQPNIVVLDSATQYPWQIDSVAQITTSSTSVNHSKYTIVFRNTFQAPFRLEPVSGSEEIQLSDNELPFVGAWLAVPATDALPARTPYRSDFMPKRFFVTREKEVDYYYLTWSAIVHLVCHNVIQQRRSAKMILEMNPAQLVRKPHYSYKGGQLTPTLGTSTRFGAPGLGSFLHAVLRPDDNSGTQYQDYLRKHSPIASLVKNVVKATVHAVTQHQLTTEKKTVGMALSSASRGEAVDVVLTGAV